MFSESSSQESPSSSSTRVVSEYFRGVQNLSIGDHGNFSTVHGDQIQHNYYSTEVKKRKFIVGSEEEENEYAEFPEIKRADFVASRNIYRSYRRFYDKEQRKYVEFKGERTAVAGDVRIGGVASKCLAVQYSGQEAGEISKSLVVFGRLDGTLLLAGVLNRSQTPGKCAIGGDKSLKHPDARTYWWYVLDACVWRLADSMADLVPITDLENRLGNLEWAYLGTLQRQMGCSSHELWMDTSRGVICRGPGEPSWFTVWHLDFEDVPSDAELLKEDVLLRYLVSRNQDRKVVYGLSFPWHNLKTSQLEVNRPTVISTLTNTIIAVGSGVWKEGRRSCLGEREELANGATRFTLKCNGRRLELGFDWREVKDDWFAQAPSIFHAHEIPLEGDMLKYKLVLPDLKGTLSNSKAKQQRREDSPPIYLFIPPLSTTTFWSCDPDGQNAITTDLCHHLGLPISLSLERREYSWMTESYEALQAYQIARGFDPHTTEFARHNQYRIYEITDQPFASRFEEINDSEPPKTPLRSIQPEELNDMSLGDLPSGDVLPEDLAANTTTQDYALQKGVVHSSNHPHSKPTAAFFGYADF
ncbi:hypothetical protein V5O48_003149, partial [Marasmius crinis-equi]